MLLRIERFTDYFTKREGLLFIAGLLFLQP
jgi:hypothetical protein